MGSLQPLSSSHEYGSIWPSRSVSRRFRAHTTRPMVFQRKKLAQQGNGILAVFHDTEYLHLNFLAEHFLRPVPDPKRHCISTTEHSSLTLSR